MVNGLLEVWVFTCFVPTGTFMAYPRVSGPAFRVRVRGMVGQGLGAGFEVRITPIKRGNSRVIPGFQALRFGLRSRIMYRAQVPDSIYGSHQGTFTSLPRVSICISDLQQEGLRSIHDFEAMQIRSGLGLGLGANLES